MRSRDSQPVCCSHRISATGRGRVKTVASILIWAMKMHGTLKGSRALFRRPVTRKGRIRSVGGVWGRGRQLFERNRSLRGSSAHRAHHRANAQDAHHALQVVGKDVQNHLGAHARQRLHQEVGPPHPGLESSRTDARPFVVGLASSRGPIQPQLHRLENSVMFSTRNAPIVARGALRLERTLGASRGPVPVQGQAVLDGGKALDGALPGGATLLIVAGDVDEVLLVEATLRLAVGGH